MTVEQIAFDTGLSTRRVYSIVGSARITDGEYQRRKVAMARGSAMLLAAIVKAQDAREAPKT